MKKTSILNHFGKILALIALFLGLPQKAQANWQAPIIEKAGYATILVEKSNGSTVFSHLAQEHFTPASTLKVATSVCAIETFGAEFHFPTAFYYDRKAKSLVVKGYGDPSLVSEELALVAKTLKSKGLREVRQILLDDSYFSADVNIDGRSSSLNPYDAHNSALLVNYNTIAVRVLKGGSVTSAEPQTPMTALTQELAKGLPPGKHRINLARNPQKALLYAGHLLKVFLQKEGVQVTGSIQKGLAPSGQKPFLLYRSSKSLADNVRDLLEYSNNIVTNQLFLVMGAKTLGAPATSQKGRAVLSACLKERLGWRHFTVMEGSGLSRKNQVTAQQMMGLLRYFERYKGLMPKKEKVFLAKTGSLRGVSSLAGYFHTPKGTPYRFVVIINDPKTTYHAKFEVAKMIYQALSGT